MKGIYLPYWTFDAKADARWTADAGEYYYVREGNRQRAARAVDAGVRRARRMSSTTNSCARRSASTRRGCERIEPFPTDTLVPYDPGYLAGWTVERYQIDLVAAADAFAAADGRRAAAVVRRAGAGRHAIAISSCDATFSEPDASSTSSRRSGC